jgi:hypothetical protein
MADTKPPLETPDTEDSEFVDALDDKTPSKMGEADDSEPRAQNVSKPG